MSDVIFFSNDDISLIVGFLMGDPKSLGTMPVSNFARISEQNPKYLKAQYQSHGRSASRNITFSFIYERTNN